MKTRASIIVLLFIFINDGYTQNEPINSQLGVLQRQLTVEPAVGIHTNFGTDLLLANLVQYNLNKRLSVAAHSSFNINNILQRDFNHVKTEYNFSLNQKFGVGSTFYTKRSAHTFFIMAGVKYTAFKETLYHPDLDKISSSVSSLNPDYGMMYSLKRGVKNYFFSFRAYIPLYPWPTKGSDSFYLDGNRDNIALELGVGFKIK